MLNYLDLRFFFFFLRRYSLIVLQQATQALNEKNQKLETALAASDSDRIKLTENLHRTQLLLNKAQSNTVRPLATQVAAATALPPVGQANPSQATLIKPGEPNKTVPQVL